MNRTLTHRSTGATCDSSTHGNSPPKDKIPSFLVLLKGLVERHGSTTALKQFKIYNVPNIVRGESGLSDLMAKRILAAHKASKHLPKKGKFNERTCSLDPL